MSVFNRNRAVEGCSVVLSELNGSGPACVNRRAFYKEVSAADKTENGDFRVDNLAVKNARVRVVSCETRGMVFKVFAIARSCNTPAKSEVSNRGFSVKRVFFARIKEV